MLKYISQELGFIINLYHTAEHHKKTCNTSDCNVSIHQLALTAKELLRTIPVEEFKEARDYIEKIYTLI